MRVQATRHYWTTGQPPDVQLVSVDGALVVEPTTAVFGANGATQYIDYVIEIPTAVGADVRSASGSIAVTGIDWGGEGPDGQWRD